MFLILFMGLIVLVACILMHFYQQNDDMMEDAVLRLVSKFVSKICFRNALKTIGHHFEIFQDKLHSKSSKPLIGNKSAKILNKILLFSNIELFENIEINKRFKNIANKSLAISRILKEQ